MTNHQFLEFCYNRILRREPDEPGLQAFLTRLDAGQCTREQVFLEFLTSGEYEGQRSEGNRGMEAFPSGHFYSAIPSCKDRTAVINSLPQLRLLRDLPGIEVGLAGQTALLRSLQQYLADSPLPDEKTPGYRYHFANPTYSYGDGLLLQAIMRHFRPNSIIEVGSGYSSALMLDINDSYFAGRIDCTFIEPYPALLRSLLHEDDNVNILERGLQEVDLTLFSRLKKNDILFIDSTHVGKLGSDVLRIFFEILPSLAPGVLVHLHDIFWPFEYPEPWIQEGRAWNEVYLLRAFLQYNTSFRILLFSNLVAHTEYDWLHVKVPRFYRNRGGNIWLQRVS